MLGIFGPHVSIKKRFLYNKSVLSPLFDCRLVISFNFAWRSFNTETLKSVVSILHKNVHIFTFLKVLYIINLVIARLIFYT